MTISEILDGQLVESPAPSREAEAVKRSLANELVRALGTAGVSGAGGAGATTGGAVGATVGANGALGSVGRVGWLIFPDPQVRLGKSLVVPDLAGWRRARLPHPPSDNRFVSVPDWLCEVLSPATAVLDRTRKLNIYANQGVCWVWMIDPGNRTVEVLWLEGDEWVLAGAFGGDDRVRVSPFDGIELDLAELWRAGVGVGQAETTVAPTR